MKIQTSLFKAVPSTATLTIGLVVFTPAISHALTLDQSSTAFDPRTRFGPSNTSGSGFRRAQTFTAGLSGALSAIQLEVENFTSGTLNILATSGGIPTETILASSSTFTSNGVSRRFDVSGLGLTVNPGDVLALELVGNGALIGSGTDIYSNGSDFFLNPFFGINSFTASTGDLDFITFVTNGGSEVRDQASDAFDPRTQFGTSGTLFSDFRRAQTFTAGLSGFLDIVELEVENFASGTLNILATSAGVPTGTILGSSSIFTSRDNFRRFDLSALGLAVNPGDVLALELVGSGRWVGSSTNVYNGGSDFFLNPSFGINSFTANTADLNFRTFVSDRLVTPEPEPIPTPALLPGLIGLGAAAWRRHREAQLSQ